MDRIDGPDQIAVDGDCLCHADLHPGNVLLGRGGPVVIDWTGRHQGRRHGGRGVDAAPPADRVAKGLEAYEPGLTARLEAYAATRR